MFPRFELVSRAWRSIIALTLAALLSACQGSGVGYLQNGIGSDLPSPSTGSATLSHEIYFNYLCRQAGIGQSCRLLPYDANWTLVVQQGMNDIDRRCDAYLQWLDDKKRSRGPLLSQVKDVQSATAALIGVFDPSNAIALQVVAQAFNLITRSIENYHSRLLLEIESSTVNSVVLRARHQFRQEISDRAFNSRPEAEYALRSYLRLCLPFAIETNINNYTTLVSQGIRLDDSNSINQAPVVGRRLLREAPESPVIFIKPPPPPPPPPVPLGGVTNVELLLQKPDIRQVQRRLCVTPSGRFDEETRAAILVAETAMAASAPNDQIDTGLELDILLAEAEGCASTPFKFASTFEKFHFRGNATMRTRDRVKEFQGAAYRCVGDIEQRTSTTFPQKPAETAFATGALDGETRRAVTFVAPHIRIDGTASVNPLNFATIEAVQNCL